jgi:hypothetical protein
VVVTEGIRERQERDEETRAGERAAGRAGGWCAQNPCKKVDKPRAGGGGDAEIRFLDEASYVRGEFGTPKSQRSSRSVPLADRVSAELDALHKRSRYGGDDDLVFGHPHLGRPLDRSRLLKRFKAAAQRAGVRDVRFHDLRHTFGTRVAGAGVPMRTLQEWMGHRDFKTTLIYADYAPSPHERALVELAFGARGINRGINLSEAAVSPDNKTSDEGRQFDRI